METKDLILRNWRDSDAKALYEMCLDEALRKSGIDFYNSITDSQSAIQCWMNDSGFKVIADKRNDNFIGFISLGGMNRYDGYMEIEYAIAAPYRNNSYAIQTVKRMLEYGFKEMNLSVIAAWVRSHNRASISVLDKCSFTFEGRLRKHARDKSDTLCYSILKEDWERKICKIDSLLHSANIDIRIMNYDETVNRIQRKRCREGSNWLSALHSIPCSRQCLYHIIKFFHTADSIKILCCQPLIPHNFAKCSGIRCFKIRSLLFHFAEKHRRNTVFP